MSVQMFLPSICFPTSFTYIQENRTEKPAKRTFRFKRLPKERARRKSALNDSAQVVDIIPEGSENYDILQFFANAKEDVKSELRNRSPLCWFFGAIFLNIHLFICTFCQIFNLFIL
jgi:hypothetical protein